jgi:serine/threonine protein kinase
MTHLHAKNRLHRDLKPANLLINHKGYVKLSDFGITKQLLSDADSKLLDLEESGSSLKDSLRSGSDDQQQQGFKKTRTFVGTASYMSP